MGNQPTFIMMVHCKKCGYVTNVLSEAWTHSVHYSHVDYDLRYIDVVEAKMITLDEVIRDEARG